MRACRVHRSRDMKAHAIALLRIVESVSLASPPEHEERAERVSYKGDKANAPPADGWIELATPTPARNGREFIPVSADAGTFTMIRIEASSGRPIVRSVRVDYADGAHRFVQLDQVLRTGAAPTLIDLHGAHELQRIIVVGDPDSRGSYRVLGTWLAPDVAKR